MSTFPILQEVNVSKFEPILIRKSWTQQILLSMHKYYLSETSVQVELNLKTDKETHIYKDRYFVIFDNEHVSFMMKIFNIALASPPNF